MSHPYDIPKRSLQCSEGKETLSPGDEIFSVLLPVADTYERRDFCRACWEKKGEELSAFPHWKGFVPDKVKAEKRPQSRDEQALDLLLQTLPQKDGEAKGLAYVLALYLERTGQLMKRHEKKGVCFFEIVDRAEVLRIDRTALAPADLAGIEKTLFARLEGASPT